MKTIYTILFLTLFILIDNNLNAQDDRWVYVTSNEEDSIDFYYDSLSIIVMPQLEMDK